MCEWGATYGRPYRCKVDGGLSYQEGFRKECKELGIQVIHSSCYNSQSQGLVERMVGVWKQQLKKTKSSLSQLQIDELVFEINSRETSPASALSRFLGNVVVYQAPAAMVLRSKGCGDGHGHVFQDSNVDFLNIDVSKHTLEEEVMGGSDYSQMLSLMQLLEWSLFDILMTVLLSLIFF